MKQTPSSDPKPAVGNQPHWLLLQFLSDHSIGETYLFESVLNNKILKVRVSLSQLCSLQRLNVSAFHAQSHKNLPTFVKLTPSWPIKGKARALISKFSSKHIKVYLLNDLQSESWLAFLALPSNLHVHNISNHKLQSKLLTRKVKPQLCYLVTMHFWKFFRNLPISSGNIWYWILRYFNSQVKLPSLIVG